MFKIHGKPHSHLSMSFTYSKQTQKSPNEGYLNFRSNLKCVCICVCTSATEAELGNFKICHNEGLASEFIRTGLQKP